ncbi:kinase-like domain-containing protein [Apiospora sp. TS-2023a]
MLPWRKVAPADRLSWNSTKRDEGGYAFVTGVMMDRSSYNFDPVLSDFMFVPNGFALKKIKSSTPQDELQGIGPAEMKLKLQKLYEYEVGILKRFGDSSQKHLIFLLVSFTLKQDLCFLFPHADCDLATYWFDVQQEPFPEIDYIKSNEDKYGILVLSDMGVSTFNRTVSRSKQPGRYVAQIPGYHPPESVIAGGEVDRKFDIWSLGCVYLEMVVWGLGGRFLLHQFKEERTILEQFTPVQTDVFYKIWIDIYDSTRQVAMVKDEVTKWMWMMHSHTGCPPFIKNVLYTIWTKMLVVLGPNSSYKRASANELGPIFEELSRLSDYDYQSRDSSSTMRREDLAAPEVEVEVAEDLRYHLRM